MPTEPIAALLYVCLLLPGIAFLWTYEGHRPVIKRSAFRESAHVVIASAASLVGVFVIHYVLGLFIAEVRASLQQFFVDPGLLLRGNSQLFFGVLLLELALAVSFGAYAGSRSADRARRWVRSKWFALRDKDVPMDRGLSAWDAAFAVTPDTYVHLGIQLKSGTWVQGKLYTYNGDGHDGPDRSLTMWGDVASCAATAIEPTEMPTMKMIVQASEIDYLTVGYETVPGSEAARGRREVS